MKTKILKAFGWDVFGSIFGYGATFVTSIFLARLLTPDEFGLIAIAMVLVFIFNLTSELGLKQALIQDQKSDQTTYSTVFYINILLAIVLTIVSYFLAPLIARFYNLEILIPVIRLLSLTFIINSLTMVQIAILSKNLDFKSLSIRILISKVAGAIAGITLAIKGFGVFALVWQEIIFSIINFLLLWYLSKWRPTLEFSYRKVKSLLIFGGYMFSNQILNQVVVKLDDLVIGKLFSINILGYYDRSNSITQLLNGVSSKSIYSFFFPFMSKFQDNEKQFYTIYNSINSIIFILSFLIAGLSYILSSEIILGLFGPQWHESISIFQILFIKLFTFPISAFLIVSILSKGYSKEIFYFGILKKILQLLSYIVAFMYGFKWFLIVIAITSIVNLVINIYVNSILLKLKFIDHINPFVQHIVLSMMLLLLYYYMKPESYDLLFNVCSSILFGIIYIGIFGKQLLLSLSLLKRETQHL